MFSNEIYHNGWPNYHVGLERVVIADGHPLDMPLYQTTIADELKRGGYATHCVGKWDLGMQKWEYTLQTTGDLIPFMDIIMLLRTILIILSEATLT